VQLRAQRTSGMRQIDPIEPARHYDIGEQHIDLQVRMCQQQLVRIIAARGLKDPIAGSLEHRERHFAHVAIVLDDKDGFCRLDHLLSTHDP